MNAKPTPGVRVRMTGEFLRNTGQFAGQDAHARWIVQECSCGLCKGGRFVAVNERSVDNPDAARHINIHNLERCR